MQQAAMVQAAVSQMSLRQTLGAAAGQQAAGDGDFAMLFRQMMGEDDAFMALLAQMAGTQEEENLLGGQMAAEMLSMMPGVQPQMMFALMQQAQMQSLSGTGWGMAASPLLTALASGQTQEGSGLDAQMSAEDFYAVLQSAWKEQPQQQMTMGMDLSSDSALRAAKELLAQKQQETTQTIDVESLQADVDAGKFLPVDTLTQGKQELPTISTGEIAEQLKSGILDNVAKGKNEFVVRLKPEGIGEIIVKLSETRDKISLSIITSSTQTARLISNEVMALQNALRPLNAEVEQITTVAPNEQAAQYAAQDMMDHGRQFAGQQQTGHGRHSSGFGMQDDGGFDGTVQKTLTEEGLDTYI